MSCIILRYLADIAYLNHLIFRLSLLAIWTTHEIVCIGMHICIGICVWRFVVFWNTWKWKCEYVLVRCRPDAPYTYVYIYMHIGCCALCLCNVFETNLVYFLGRRGLLWAQTWFTFFCRWALLGAQTWFTFSCRWALLGAQTWFTFLCRWSFWAQVVQAHLEHGVPCFANSLLRIDPASGTVNTIDKCERFGGRAAFCKDEGTCQVMVRWQN